MQKLWNAATVLHMLHSYLFFFVRGAAGACACSCTSKLTGFCSDFPFYELFLLTNIVNRGMRLLRSSVCTAVKSCVLCFWSVGPSSLSKFWPFFLLQKLFTSADVVAAHWCKNWTMIRDVWAVSFWRWGSTGTRCAQLLANPAVDGLSDRSSDSLTPQHL